MSLMMQSVLMEQDKAEQELGRRCFHYQSVYHRLERDIANGHYQHNEFLPTELTLAQQFGVSRPTIAKAMRLLKDKGWIRRRRGLGTVVTHKQESQRWNVGLVIPELDDNEIYNPICQAIATASQQEHLSLCWTSSPDDSQDRVMRMRAITKQCLRLRLDGVFFAPLDRGQQVEEINTEIVHQLISAGIRVVLLDHDMVSWPRQSACDCVSLDHMQAGFLMTEHVLDQGGRRPVFVQHHRQVGSAYLRRMGCQEAVLQAGLPYDSLRLCELSQNDDEEKVKDFLQSGVDAVIAANDALAARILRVLLDQDIRVPEQVQVVGFDNVRYAALLSVPLTTYHHPTQEIGRQAAHLMHMRLQSPNRSARRLYLSGELVIRRSSRV